VLLQDIQREVKARQESLSIKGVEISKNLQEVFFVGGMKVERSVKKMTVREFNEKFLKGSGENIINVMKDIMKNTKAASVGAKKRVRGAGYTNTNTNTNTPANHLVLETPVRQLKAGKASRTPGTILRTAKKGEGIYSSNGSPMNTVDDGDLVATVSKKRKGNGNDDGGAGALFDINIDGRTISLSDPSTMEHLTNEMKNTAKNQLNILQDQLSKLLSHLN